MRSVPLAMLLSLMGLTGLSAASDADACDAADPSGRHLVLPLDEAMSAPGSFAELFTRDTSLAMLRGLLPATAVAVIDGGDRWLVACELLSVDLGLALSGMLAVDGTVDPRQLREIFEANYLDTVAVRQHDTWIRPTREQMLDATGFKSWASRIVPLSGVKRLSRRVFRSPAGFAPMIAVSETLDSTTGDPAAAVLETEVAIRRADALNWDFYAYNRGGDLSDYSTFPGGERPAPRICIGCHYDAGSRGINRFF